MTIFFLNNNVIAIGWKEFGDLSKISNSREAFKERYIKIYPNEKKGAIATCAGMLYRFMYEIQIGDYVIFPSKVNREIYIGIVEGEYSYVPEASEYVQQRKVKWLKHFPRTVFSQGALYEVGSAMALFTVKNYAEDYLQALNKDFKKSDGVPVDEDESVGATAEQIQESTKDFIMMA